MYALEVEEEEAEEEEEEEEHCSMAAAAAAMAVSPLTSGGGSSSSSGSGSGGKDSTVVGAASGSSSASSASGAVGTITGKIDWSKCIRKSAHVVLCPLLRVGHLNPMMVLGRKLALLGLSVTVLVPGDNPFRRILQDNPTEGLDVLLEVLDLDYDESAQPRSIATGARRLQVDMAAMAVTMSMYSMHGEALRKKFEEIKASPSPPVYAIVDYLLFSSASEGFLSANANSVPISVFCPISAASIIFHMSLLQQTLPTALATGFVIPGLPPFKPHDISDYYRETSHVLNLLFSEHTNLLAEFHSLIINTFYELETGPLDILQLDAKATKSKLHPVGPLLPPSFFSSEADKDKPLIIRSAADEECKAWLDDHEARSVVYICFGSWISLSKSQICELAHGLEASDQCFVWVFSAEKEMNALPEGFRRRTTENGKGYFFCGWAPQFMILSHKSTAAFVTTCAWNSVLECISLGGIGILAWPVTMDHLPTCRYLVDVLKIAVEVIGDGDERLVGRDEVTSAVLSVMVGDEAVQIRKRATHLKDCAAAASTNCNDTTLRAFVTEVLRQAHRSSSSSSSP